MPSPGDLSRNEVRREVGATLRRVRREKRLSQEELAEAAAVTTVFISSIERAKSSVSVANLASLARARGIRTCDLIGDP